MSITIIINNNNHHCTDFVAMYYILRKLTGILKERRRKFYFPGYYNIFSPLVAAKQTNKSDLNQLGFIIIFLLSFFKLNFIGLTMVDK